MENADLINIYIKNILTEMTELQKKKILLESQIELQNNTIATLNASVEQLRNENSILKKRKSGKAAEE